MLVTRYGKRLSLLIMSIAIIFSLKNDLNAKANEIWVSDSSFFNFSFKKMKQDANDSPGNSSSLRFETIDTNFVKSYAPILHFHPKEGKQCCFPSNAEEAYPRAKMGKTGKFKYPKTLKDNTPCYFEALYTQNGFRIKYWFWYNYNDYPTGPNLWGSHPGDWEYFEILFENEKPTQYIFSNHTGVRVKNPHEVALIDNHVEVWVGSGSHANYESSNPKNIWTVFWFPDKVADGGSTWNTSDNLVDIKNTIFCRDNYLGDWGDGKKIFGPISRLDN